MHKRIAVCVNESSGRGNGSYDGYLAFEAFNQLFRDYSVVDVSGASIEQTNINIQKVIKIGIDALMVVGGDGMVNLGLNAIIDTNIPLGIVPSGSGNDLARRSLHIPVNNVRLVAEGLHSGLKKKSYKMVDVVRATPLLDAKNSDYTNSRWFFSSLSMGLDAKINQTANKSKLPTSNLRYKVSGFREALKSDTYDYDISFSGVEIDKNGIIASPSQKFHLQKRGLLACVSSAPFVGSGIKIAPFVRIDDGYLHLIFVDPLTRMQALRLFPTAFGGQHILLKTVHQYRAKKFIITPGECAPPICYADGEQLGKLPLEVEIFKQKVPVIMAPKALENFK